MTPVTDWDRYRACPKCGAGLGRPCRRLSGYAVNSGSGAGVVAEADAPHTGRVLRTGYARTGGDRG